MTTDKATQSLIRINEIGGSLKVIHDIVLEVPADVSNTYKVFIDICKKKVNVLEIELNKIKKELKL